jgi:hypothetical protein
MVFDITGRLCLLNVHSIVFQSFFLDTVKKRRFYLARPELRAEIT